jgi:hypothetical protein
LAKTPIVKPINAGIPKFLKACSLVQSAMQRSFFDKLKDNTIKCMIYDQEKSIQKQEKFMDLEEAVNQLIKQNESLQDKLMYHEDLVEKKDHDLVVKKQEVKDARKAINDLKFALEESKNNRKSAGSLTGRGDMTASFRSERKQR